jgi:O-antigen/teichoic acid export membrane protein
LQGVGRADLTGKLNLVELPFYLITIWLLARTLGLAGVAMAWTLRVLVDTVALSVMARRNLVTDRRLLRTPVMTWLTMALALLVGAMLPSTAARIAYVFAAAAVYLPVAWFGLVTPSERRAVWRIMRRSVGTIDDPTRQAA